MSSLASSRFRSLFDAARSVPWWVVLLDLAVVIAWIVAVSLAFTLIGEPRWLYYLVALGGVIGYSLASDPWLFRNGSD